MKIAIIGYSGSGKSTLAAKLGKKYSLPVLHLDTVQFLPNWVIRDDYSKIAITKEFLDNNSDYVIDGNYRKLFFERRMAEADKIIFMNFNRFSCAYRVLKRYFKYRGQERESMAAGCKEKIDAEFLWWVFAKGRTKERRALLKNAAKKYADKTVVIKNQRELDKYENAIGL